MQYVADKLNDLAVVVEDISSESYAELETILGEDYYTKVLDDIRELKNNINKLSS